MARAHATQTLDVTSGTIWKQLLMLSVPVFLSSFFQEAYFLINTYVVGQFAGKAALGGMQATQALVDLVVSFSVGVGTGCAVICGQCFGAGDQKRLVNSVHTAFGIALVLGSCLSVAGLLVVKPLLELMGTPDDLIGQSLAFARPYFGALVFSIVYNMGSAIQRALGDTKTPSVIVATSCLVNIFFDLLFVMVLDLEALGAGLATGLSLAFGAIVTTWHLAHVQEPWRLRLSQVRIDPALGAVMLRTGLPLGVQSSVYGISNIVVQSTINGFGSDAVTGWGLSARLDGVVWMISDALGVAVTTFAAQNFGARNYARMRRALKTSLVLTATVVGTTSALIYLFAPSLAHLFVDDPSVTSFTTRMLHFISPWYVFFSLMDNVAGTIRGAGESLRPMLLSIVGTCVLRIAWLLVVVPQHHTLEAVLVSFPVTWVVTGVLFVLYYKFGHWLRHAEEHEAAALAA